MEFDGEEGSHPGRELSPSNRFSFTSRLIHFCRCQESMFIHGSAAAACDILITISLVAILRSSDTATRRSVSSSSIENGIFKIHSTSLEREMSWRSSFAIQSTEEY